MGDEAFAGESTVRKRLRRHEVANTLAILCFAAIIVAVGAFAVARFKLFDRPPPRPPPLVTAPAPPIPVRTVKPPVIPPAPAASNAATPAAPPPKPLPPRPAASPPAKSTVAAAPAKPRVRFQPPEPTAPAPASPPTELAAMDRPSGPAAKQMLNSIKCFDQFEFDFRAGGRQFFSALCKGGNRMQVSCAGAGCKIVYAPPPSHYPTGG